MAAEASIPEYERLSKPILYKRLQDQYNMERLERTGNRRQAKRKRSLVEDDIESFALEPLKARTRKSVLKQNQQPAKSSSASSKSSSSASSSSSSSSSSINLCDPIMLCPIGKKVYDYVRANGTICRFNVGTLIDYLLSSGNFHDPETRAPFSDDVLQDIDKTAKKYGMVKASVYEAKKNPQRYADKKFVRDALQGLERCCDEIVSEMLRMIENYDADEAETRFAMNEFPSFADYYQQIKVEDPSYAKQCMRHWKLFLAGPPNRPTKDYQGLLPIVLRFLQDCDTNHGMYANGNDFADY